MANYTMSMKRNECLSGLDASGLSLDALHQKLSKLGYDRLIASENGSYYGFRTLFTVFLFQLHNGLDKDGEIGSATKSKLESYPDERLVGAARFGDQIGKLDYGPNPNINPVEALARTIYSEDTSSSDGRQAIAYVMYNRRTTTQENFGNSWIGIVYGNDTATSADFTSAFRALRDYCLPELSAAWAEALALAKSLTPSGQDSDYATPNCTDSEIRDRVEDRYFFNTRSRNDDESDSYYDSWYIDAKIIGNNVFHYGKQP